MSILANALLPYTLLGASTQTPGIHLFARYRKLTEIPKWGKLWFREHLRSNISHTSEETQAIQCSEAHSTRRTAALLKHLLKTMRPKQWAKNVFIFAALIFDKKLLVPSVVLRTTAAFVLFCLLSSSVYLINDLVDMERDRQHPTKKDRPLASGRLKPSIAVVAAVVFIVVAISLGFALEPRFGTVELIYLVTMILYSFFLKNIVIVDVLTVAAGFVLRVMAGTVVFPVERFSPWLYVCMSSLALFIAVGKRRHELILLKGNANNHRAILDEYNLQLIDNVLNIATSTTVVAYSLYTFSAPNLPPNHMMMLTIPPVVYGLLRYLYLIQVKGEGGAPEEIALGDKHLILDVGLWGLLSASILYFS